MNAAVLHDLLDAAAVRHPDQTAVSDGTDALTYAEVRAASVRIATWLRQRGVGPRDRIVVSEAAGPWLVPLLTGASRVGAVSVPLSAAAPDVVVRHILDDAGPTLVVGGAVTAGEAARRGLAHADLDELRDAARSWPPDAGAPSPTLPVDPAWFIYTSGSTGAPKAVVSTHGQIVFAARAIHHELGYGTDDVVYSPLPLSFDYGLYQVLLSTLGGARLELGSAKDAGRVLVHRLRDTGATVFPAVPSLAATLARLVERPGVRAPALRLLTNTGAAMPADVLTTLRKQISGLRVQLMYGLTECKRATIMPPDGDLLRPGSSGRALRNTEVFVVDQDGNRLPPGRIGEIVVRGPHVMSGYWRQPELTARRFRRAEGLFPQLHTGDYGSVDAEGYLYFDGRHDDVYKERGTRVSSLEVEAAADRIPGVRAACAVPPRDATAGATLVVASELSPGRVLAALTGQLEETKIPRSCVTLPALPLTANGKIDRSRLARLVEETRDA
ncbi:class I adenylate-forming enzyme family protein [Streptomyces sp. B6B3]|uniref:class I adenylate-forming enzyme family protein n=1 Tax=Streptomyces sp. B6B3 TaxID=3153570 RepID=UPI00325DA7A1